MHDPRRRPELFPDDLRQAHLNHIDFAVDSFERIIVALKRSLEHRDDPDAGGALAEAERAARVFRRSQHELLADGPAAPRDV